MFSPIGVRVPPTPGGVSPLRSDEEGRKNFCARHRHRHDGRRAYGGECRPNWGEMEVVAIHWRPWRTISDGCTRPTWNEVRALEPAFVYGLQPAVKAHAYQRPIDVVEQDLLTLL